MSMFLYWSINAAIAIFAGICSIELREASVNYLSACWRLLLCNWALIIFDVFSLLLLETFMVPGKVGCHEGTHAARVGAACP